MWVSISSWSSRWEVMYFGIYDTVVSFTEYCFSKMSIFSFHITSWWIGQSFFFHVSFFVSSEIYRSLCHLISSVFSKKPPSDIWVWCATHLPYPDCVKCYAGSQGNQRTMLEVWLKSRPIFGRLPKVVFFLWFLLCINSVSFQLEDLVTFITSKFQTCQGLVVIWDLTISLVSVHLASFNCMFSI